MFFELNDDDPSVDPDELIDRFAINVSIPVGTNTSSITYQGIFGLAEIDVSFGLKCMENFYGPNCDIICLDNCTCEPGFTGEFCATSIDDCVGMECELNQRCMDGHFNFSCECQPGYTGSNCTIDIDECEEVDCNNGICDNRLASYTCICNPGYTGQFCATQLDAYEMLVMINSFTNPGSLCADQSCGGNCCDQQCFRCDYYFSMCQRPAGTPFSYERNENKGNCSSLSTFVYEGGTISFFSDTVFGISNPIVFTGTQWVNSV